jgi:hypothetical protein
MLAEERQFVTEQLTASEARLLALTEVLRPEQWHFREAPERWTIAEIVEHMVVFEAFIRSAVATALEGEPEPEKKAFADEKERLVLGLATSREVKFQTREVNRPQGRWSEGAELLAEFRRARAITLAFVAETGHDLRSHFFRHIAFGDLDCYQWLVLLGPHTLRHCAQIEEIFADPKFPSA